MTSKGKETEDDIYCACLSKALCQVATPVTVGLYAPFGGRVYMLLDRITKCMREEASRITEKEETTLKQTTVKPHGCGFLQLLWRLLFYCPVITSRHQERKSIQFIFVHFSAWQYAGSDRLWAGLVTTLCDQIRRHFGIVPLSIFSVLGSVPKVSLEEEDVKEWRFKKYFCIILMVIIILLLIGLVLLLVPINFSSHGIEERISTAFGGLATVIAGSGIAMTLFQFGKSVLISQKQKIERLVNSQKFSSQMGFMNEVKKEVEVITQMVQYMEIFQKQKIRVVLQITSLELCAPDKVVGVLDAMNTLLSDQRSPFISILVVDPSIIVTCLESAGSLKGMADNGYMFLNRTVTLPFSVPALGKKTKLQLLRKAVQRTEDLIDWPCRNDANRGTKTGIAESMKLLREELSEDDDAEERIPAFQPAYCIQEAFYALYSEREVLHEYIPDSICQMKRIVNAIPVMVHLMMLSKIPWGNLSAKSVAAWVVLCNQWPCRLSWILQCLEDEEQKGSKEGFGNSLLWDVFKENSKELFAMKTGLKNLLDLDGDPEIFQQFLSKDFPFTVEESRRLIKCTINLDFSVKNKMGLHRGINSLQNDWKDASVNKTETEVDISINQGNDRKKTVEEEGPGCSKDPEGRDISRMQWKESNLFKSVVNEEIGEGPIWTKQEKELEGATEDHERNTHTHLFTAEVNREFGEGPIWTKPEKVLEGATEKPKRNIHTNLFKSEVNKEIGEGEIWTMREKVCKGATEELESNIHSNMFNPAVNENINGGPIRVIQEKVVEGVTGEHERNIPSNVLNLEVGEEIGEGPKWTMQEKLVEGATEEPERNIHTNLFNSEVNENVNEGPIWTGQEKAIEGKTEEPERHIHKNVFKSEDEKIGEGPIWTMQEKVCEGATEEPERNIQTNLLNLEVDEEISEVPIWTMHKKLLHGVSKEPERNIHINLFKSEVDEEIGQGSILTIEEIICEGVTEGPEWNIHTNLFKSQVDEEIAEEPIWTMQEKVCEGATEGPERNIHTNLLKSKEHEKIGEAPIWTMQEKVCEGAQKEPERNIHTNLYKSQVDKEIEVGPILTIEEIICEGVTEKPERNIHTTPTLEHCTECDCRQCNPVMDTSQIELFLDSSNWGLINQTQNDDNKHILQTQDKAVCTEDDEFQELSAKLIMVHDEDDDEEEESDHTIQIQTKELLG